MTTNQADYGWPLPEATDPPDGPAQMLALADGIAATITGVKTTADTSVENAGQARAIRALTQAEYDALTPDPTTWYLIVG